MPILGSGATWRRLSPALGVVAIVALWIVGGRRNWADGMIVTPAEAVSPLLGDSRRVYVRATQSTVWAAARGLLIGSTLAFVAALMAAAVPALRRTIGRFAAIANAAPWVAVAPCLLIVLGRGRGPVAVAAIAVFFSVFAATSIGLASASRASHDVLTALGASRPLRVRVLQLPAACASLIDGLRLAAPASLAGAIFGEWYGADRGLGVLLISGMQSGRAERLWAASLLSAGAGVIAYAVLALGRRLFVARFGASVTQTDDVTVVPSGRLRTLATEAMTTVGIISALIMMWFVWIETADISPLVVPRPSRVWRDLAASPGEYAAAAGSTVITAAIALLLGSVLGAIAAAGASRIPVLAGATVPVVVLLSATPLVALLPLFARVFGYEPRTVRFLAATMVFFPVFVYTRSGLTAPAGSSGDALHAMGAAAGRRFRLLTAPAAIPHLASGLRIAAGSAVIAAVVGESLIGRSGLGVEFTAAYRTLVMPRAFGAALVIVVVSVIVFALAGAAERAVHARWR